MPQWEASEARELWQGGFGNGEAVDKWGRNADGEHFDAEVDGIRMVSLRDVAGILPEDHVHEHGAAEVGGEEGETFRASEAGGEEGETF